MESSDPVSDQCLTTSNSGGVCEGNCFWPASEMVNYSQQVSIPHGGWKRTHHIHMNVVKMMLGNECVAEPWRSGMVCRLWPRHLPVYGVHARQTSLPPAVELLIWRGGTTHESYQKLYVASSVGQWVEVVLWICRTRLVDQRGHVTGDGHIVCLHICVCPLVLGHSSVINSLMEGIDGDSG